jgi:transposase-like protein
MTNSACPQCNSKAYKRNGYTRHGKQNHRCLDCGRQFSLEPPESFQSHENSEAEIAMFAVTASTESV